MSLAPWDELRTALHVARAGTVSGAAQALGVHHATVIRHVDALEDRLGVKLFQRHAKGYSPTEAGQALAEVAGGAEQNFDALAARLHGLQDGISGELVITTVPELCLLIMPAVQSLVAAHPALKPCLRTEERVLQLEYGEAHLAIRAGARPQEPDNVVQALGHLPFALYGAESYLAQHGTPKDLDDLSTHRFIGADVTHIRAPFDVWLQKAGHKVGLRSNSSMVRAEATRAGLGLGFLTPALVPGGLVQVLAPQPEWAVPIWLVTHVDLHRSAKVQAATAAFKQILAPASG
ncbi:LysR family transcriptional regulator [Roseinatronobacter alkalisoli]|uniref:LysR family transcriptional regulator n=1 Tax=Roseinatronobacter alkalisoli TaxID=3028235 RepID=A0ABT5T7X3_9RHOB|nr:LysR family transcriptional regulator [Roseinatronobacter sp. HJB301]MDD7971230.1 LysR family transcriptional regulator [Roseinatronobacter sp. HJB301]